MSAHTGSPIVSELIQPKMRSAAAFSSGWCRERHGQHRVVGRFNDRGEVQARLHCHWYADRLFVFGLHCFAFGDQRRERKAGNGEDAVDQIEAHGAAERRVMAERAHADRCREGRYRRDEADRQRRAGETEIDGRRYHQGQHGKFPSQQSRFEYAPGLEVENYGAQAEEDTSSAANSTCARTERPPKAEGRAKASGVTSSAPVASPSQ